MPATSPLISINTWALKPRPLMVSFLPLYEAPDTVGPPESPRLKSAVSGALRLPRRSMKTTEAMSAAGIAFILLIVRAKLTEVELPKLTANGSVSTNYLSRAVEQVGLSLNDVTSASAADPVRIRSSPSSSPCRLSITVKCFHHHCPATVAVRLTAD